MKRWWRHPAVPVTAVIVLALGIGSSAAVFSVVDRILFRSLPFPDDERLVSVGMTAPIIEQEFLLGADYLEWRVQQQPFTSITTWSGVADCDLTESNPVRMRCANVESTFLGTFGVKPLLGRGFTRAEDQPNAAPVALISYGLWQSRFGGDAGALERTLSIDGRETRIIGVLPRDFETPTLAPADLVTPMAMDEARQQRPQTGRILQAFARLKPGVTREQAAAALAPLMQNSMQFVPAPFRKEVKLLIRSLRDRQVQDARYAAWVLLAAVLSVLSIACANVANLLLARAAVRRNELALRMVLGATKGQLLRAALAESVALSMLGAGAGCGVAALLLRVAALTAPSGVPRLQDAGLDWRVLLFAFGAALVCGAAFSLAPLFELPRAGLLNGWRFSRNRFRQALVIAQVAMSLALVAVSFLLTRSLFNLQNQPLGLEANQVTLAHLALGNLQYPTREKQFQFYEQVEQRLASLPGSQAAIADSLPPAGPARSHIFSQIQVAGRERKPQGTGGMVTWRAVTPGYFATLAVPILKGRGFTEADRAAGEQNVVLGATLAKRLFGGEDPIGKRVQMFPNAAWSTVIGIAADVKNAGLARADDPEYYEVRRHAPQDTGRRASIAIRSPLRGDAVESWVREQIAAIDPTMPVTFETMEARVHQLSDRLRFQALLLGTFATVGLLLAAIGLYGVMAFLVAERTQEIGVRMALGATRGRVIRDTLTRAGSWLLIGCALGLGLIWASARSMRALLFQIDANDPRSIAAAVGALLLAGFVAAWIPSRRAAAVDPMQALRRD